MLSRGRDPAPEGLASREPQSRTPRGRCRRAMPAAATSRPWRSTGSRP